MNITKFNSVFIMNIVNFLSVFHLNRMKKSHQLGLGEKHLRRFKKLVQHNYINYIYIATFKMAAGMKFRALMGEWAMMKNVQCQPRGRVSVQGE